MLYHMKEVVWYGAAQAMIAAMIILMMKDAHLRMACNAATAMQASRQQYRLSSPTMRQIKRERQFAYAAI